VANYQKRRKWKVDFKKIIQGGKATITIKVGDKEYTRVFHIRGINPKKSIVLEYSKIHNSKYWFFSRIIQHETGSTGDVAKQFYPPESTEKGKEGYGPEWTDSKGMPVLGPPCGWGIMQLDNPKPTKKALWSWKKNIDEGVKLFDEKLKDVKEFYKRQLILVSQWNRDNTDRKAEGHADKTIGTVTYTHASSNIEGLGKTDVWGKAKDEGMLKAENADFWDVASGTKKSFMDATLIKYYNGGYYYYFRKGNTRTDSEWYLNETQTYGNGKENRYVDDISKLSE